MQFEYTMSFAFFVVMGGLHIERSRIAQFLSKNDPSTPWKWKLWKVSRRTYGRERVTYGRDRVYVTGAERRDVTSFPLTPQGVLDLCKHGCWAYLPRTAIDDKSKANQTQKTLVLLQVSWLVLQCIARRVYGLPLTLLEVHTMVHVVCAVILYLFWFEVQLSSPGQSFISC